MANQQPKKRGLLIFYFLVGYVLLQSFWWTYLLVRQQKTIYELNQTIAELKTEASIHQEVFGKKIAMVIGESLVFITLLLVGTLVVRRTFKKEQSLGKQQNNFLLSVTHELKSPIASIKLNLQTLLKRSLEKEKQDQIVTTSLNETDRLEQLVENMLLAARMEENKILLNDQQIDISSFVYSLGKEFTDKHPEYFFELRVEKDLRIKGDEFALRTVFLNLIENSIKYSPTGTTITIELYKKSSDLIFKVTDQGYGISQEEKLKVFDKFYRSGDERTRRTKGTGLGLYIVKNLVKLHKGQITISDRKPNGTVVEVALPL